MLVICYCNREKKVHLVNGDHKVVPDRMAGMESEVKKVNADRQVRSVQKDIVEKLVCLDIKELIQIQSLYTVPK